MGKKIDETVQNLYDVFEGINFSECKDCSQCCYMPWLLEEERENHDLSHESDHSVTRIGTTSFILNPNVCVYRCQKKNRCDLYDKRPLDCRIFPLDIIEEDGVYWWCIFTSCPQNNKIREKLIPLIPKLETLITRQIFDQFKAQIETSKEMFLPYKLKQYEKIKKFNTNF